MVLSLLSVLTHLTLDKTAVFQINYVILQNLVKTMAHVLTMTLDRMVMFVHVYVVLTVLDVNWIFDLVNRIRAGTEVFNLC